MAMYGVATIDFFKLVRRTHVSQKWYPDNGRAVGRLEDLLLFFKQFTEDDSYFGYNLNAPKCHIIAKEASKIKTIWLFEGTAVENFDCFRVLGSVFGIDKTYENFNVTTAVKYSNLLRKSGQVAKTSPHNAYACLRRGVQQKINFAPEQQQSREISSQT